MIVVSKVADNKSALVHGFQWLISSPRPILHQNKYGGANLIIVASILIVGCESKAIKGKPIILWVSHLNIGSSIFIWKMKGNFGSVVKE